MTISSRHRGLTRLGRSIALKWRWKVLYAVCFFSSSCIYLIISHIEGLNRQKFGLSEDRHRIGHEHKAAHFANKTGPARTDLSTNPGEENFFVAAPNEPFLYLKSAFVDFRFNPPVIWILAVVGKQSLEDRVCHVSPTSEGPKPTQAQILFSFEKKCFFDMVIFHCNFTQNDPPQHVTVAAKNAGMSHNFVGKTYAGLI